MCKNIKYQIQVDEFIEFYSQKKTKPNSNLNKKLGAYENISSMLQWLKFHLRY